jgi:DNA modification methylase
MPKARPPNSPPDVQLQWAGKHRPPPALAPALEMLEQVGDAASDGWRNRLILGDNRLVLPALAAEFAGQVACIYIDPPFATGTSFQTTAPGGPPQPAYSDEHGGLASYLQMIYERLLLLRPLLAPHGSLFVHLDWHAAHYVKLILDEVFGGAQFRNEIIWRYRRWPARSRLFQRMHDTIFWYTVGGAPSTWHQLYEALSPSSLAQWGGKRRVDRQSARGTRYSETGADASPGAPMSDVWEIPALSAPYAEYVGYATQKPEALIARILEATTGPGDLVADVFCGAGTTPVVATQLGRRWLACDSGPLAIHLTRKRLLTLPACPPFDEWRVASGEEALVPVAVENCMQPGGRVDVELAGAAGVDYWAVDFDYHGVFRPGWRAFRTRKRPTLDSACAHTYPAPGRYILAIRALDRAGQGGMQYHPVVIEGAG